MLKLPCSTITRYAEPSYATFVKACDMKSLTRELHMTFFSMLSHDCNLYIHCASLVPCSYCLCIPNLGQQVEYNWQDWHRGGDSPFTVLTYLSCGLVQQPNCPLFNNACQSNRWQGKRPSCLKRCTKGCCPKMHSNWLPIPGGLWLFLNESFRHSLALREDIIQLACAQIVPSIP